MLLILYAKYEEEDLHKVLEAQCQHLTMIQHSEFMKLLQRSKELFDGTLGTWETDSIYFELKEDVNKICSRPYPILKVHEEMFKK